MDHTIRLMVWGDSILTAPTLTVIGVVPVSIGPIPTISVQGSLLDHHLHRLLPQACHRDSEAGDGLSCMKQSWKGGP